MTADAVLTPEQTRALFDILTHHETYAEIEGFKHPDAVTGYGYPFKSVTRIPLGSRSQSSTPFGSGRTTPRSRSPMPPERKQATEGGGDGTDEEDEVPPHCSTAPVLQTLLTRFVLPLPWLRDLPRDFWAVRVQGMLERLAEAGLSESYDKGTLGLRKTLATGSSALIEMVGRGALGGVKKDNDAQPKTEYDHTRAEDLERAWDDAVQELVYGDLVPDMFKHMTKTEDLEAYAPFAKATVDYAIVHLAAFMHHIFVVSPEGQYFLQLLQNVHNLIPYKMVKQTLRIGNAATMINGMIRLLLAKMSVGGLTNWIGLTTNADDGMNLLQRIMSLVLGWDAAEFRKSAERVEKESGAVDEVLQTIRDFVEGGGRVQHDAVRKMSLAQSQSIVTAILTKTEPELAASLSEEQHGKCLEYISALFSARDRDAISGVLCRQQPDLFTHMVREVVNSYEPFIRMLHQGVDLREYVELAQGFIDDFIRASKPKKVGAAEDGEMRPPSVEDYVELLRKNKGIMYKWVHAVASNCPEVWDELKTWMEQVVVKFRPAEQAEEEEATAGTNEANPGRTSMEGRLDELVRSLPDSSLASVLTALDTHSEYLANLSKLSRSHFQRILDSTAHPDTGSHSQAGPGMYLSRWHSLLDETPITPDLPVGPIRRGREVKHTLAMGKTSIVDGKAEAAVAAAAAAEKPLESGPRPPDVSVVVKELGEGFVRVLQEIGGPDT